MIRVLYGMDYLVAGGVEAQTTALIAGLDRKQFDPMVLVLYANRAGRNLHFLPHLERARVSVHLLDATLSKWGKVRAFTGIILTGNRVRPHILHTVNYHGGILSGAALPFLPRQTKLVISVRAENTPKQMRNQQLSWQRTAAIICNGSHLKQQLVEEAGINAEKITVIPNGLDVAAFSQSIDPTLRQRLAPGATTVLVAMGRINHKKAQHLLVEALGLLKTQGNLPDMPKVLIVGEREEAETQAKIDAAIQRYDLTAQVTQLDQTDRPVDFYHSADFTVVPSLSEGTPNVMLESLAAGRPVIISEGGNKAGVIQHDVNGWIFRTGDAPHLAATIETALQVAPDTLEVMRLACRETAKTFDMRLMIERHQAVYVQVTQSP